MMFALRIWRALLPRRLPMPVIPPGLFRDRLQPITATCIRVIKLLSPCSPPGRTDPNQSRAPTGGRDTTSATACQSGSGISGALCLLTAGQGTHADGIPDALMVVPVHRARCCGHRCRTRDSMEGKVMVHLVSSWALYAPAHRKLLMTRLSRASPYRNALSQFLRCDSRIFQRFLQGTAVDATDGHPYLAHHAFIVPYEVADVAGIDSLSRSMAMAR